VRVRNFANGFRGRVVTFGFEKDAMFRVAEVRPSEDGSNEFRVSGPNLDATFRLALAGRHNVQNALAALAVASLFNIPAEELRQAFATFQNLPRRGEILTLPGQITVINDSYNSNPRALECMLEVLAAFPGAQRRILVAGEMLELGPSSPALHRETGRKCAASRIDWLIAVQGDAQFFLEGAQAGGMPRNQLRFFPEARQAGDFCRTLLQPGDVVLVKGSRAVRMETVTELLCASPLPRSAGVAAPARDSSSAL
jgi:UDP-N-acetylmuramoyl-tripeptide--D-alanyl-D-alanine ligase